jgi:hypothetical protein
MAEGSGHTEVMGFRRSIVVFFPRFGRLRCGGIYYVASREGLSN